MPEFKGFSKNENGEPLLMAFFPHARILQPSLNPDGSIKMNVIPNPHERGLTKQEIAWELTKLENFQSTDPQLIEDNNTLRYTYANFRHMLNTHAPEVTTPMQRTATNVQPALQPNLKFAVN